MPPPSSTTFNLLIALLALVILIVFCLVTLMALRHIRRARAQSEQQLPLYNDHSAHANNHQSLTISTSRNSNIYVYQEKQKLIDDSSPPDSPVPEIRITFPEEIDEAGKRKSGRVVVVRVGDHSIGLEPLQESLPVYQQDSTERFQSLDLERIGGLKEKI